jgi:hypothetical protein
MCKLCQQTVAGHWEVAEGEKLQAVVSIPDEHSPAYEVTYLYVDMRLLPHLAGEPDVFANQDPFAAELPNEAGVYQCDVEPITDVPGGCRLSNFRLLLAVPDLSQ